jgi:hypothetical protein
LSPPRLHGVPIKTSAILLPPLTVNGADQGA